jgi:hypothetical protein
LANAVILGCQSKPYNVEREEGQRDSPSRVTRWFVPDTPVVSAT